MLPIILTAILGQTLQADLDALVASPPTHVYRLTASHTLDQTLRMPSNITFTCAEGTVIEAAAGAFKDAGDVPEASLIALEGVENVTIIGCTFRGPKASEVPGSEFRHAIRIVGSKNVTMKNLTVEGSGGDGLYVGPRVGTARVPCENIAVSNSKFTGHYRQSVSIVSCVGCSLTGCEFNLSKGRAPQSGIDIEPSHPTDRVSAITVENCTAKGNGGSAFMVNLDRQTTASLPVSVTFNNCSASDIPNGHHLIRVMEYGSNQQTVKPKGSIVWDKSSWKNE